MNKFLALGAVLGVLVVIILFFMRFKVCSIFYKCANKKTEIQAGLEIVKVWVDGGGESHFGTYKVTLKDCGTIGQISDLIKGNGVMFRTTPANYNFKWHNAPRVQFVVNLDAAVEITVSDGETKVIDAGQMFLLQDTWGKGHHSKSVGGKARTSLFIPIEV